MANPTRCVTHELAAGPDGRCVLCRRRGKGRASWLPMMLLIGSLCFTAGLVLAVHQKNTARSRALAQLSSAAALPEIPAAPALSEATEQRTVRDDVPLPQLPEPRARAPAPTATVVPVMAQAAPAATATASPASSARPTAAQVNQALRDVNIVMFSTSWCSVCARARNFFRANGMAFEERDIDRDAAARLELKRRTGRSEIPTLVIEGQQLEPGFSESNVMSTIADVLRRKLGVDDLRLERVR